ncbi:MAG: glycerate kinase [Bacteroidia bacterium]|nr:glycerate kinase [Bacteroidia bacterium]
MKILLCPDKFKGSLSAQAVCEAIEIGLLASDESIEVIHHPMADGGDGSISVLANLLGLQERVMLTTDPLGRPLSASYFTSSTAAFIEVASASGIVLLQEQERNPLRTTTLGTGTLMADAIGRGYRQIYLFLGGSATNDAGIGIATAMGYQFLDQNEQLLAPIGENLQNIHRIKPGMEIDCKKISITMLCDVTNPLYGPNGAAEVYARQKGASEADVSVLDEGLRHFSEIIRKEQGLEIGNIQGGGAAGGISAGLSALLGATIASGFDTIATLTGLEPLLQQADWVISGEGKLDSQSLQGKVAGGVAALCLRNQKKLLLFVGKNELPEADTQKQGVTKVYAIDELARDQKDAMQNAASYLTKIARQSRSVIH